MNIRNQINPSHPRSTFTITYHMKHPAFCFHSNKQLTNDKGVALTHHMEYTHAVTNEVRRVADEHFDTDKDNAIHDHNWKVTGEWLRDEDTNE